MESVHQNNQQIKMVHTEEINSSNLHGGCAPKSTNKEWCTLKKLIHQISMEGVHQNNQQIKNGAHWRN